MQHEDQLGKKGQQPVSQKSDQSRVSSCSEILVGGDKGCVLAAGPCGGLYQDAREIK